jgi:hypothetical protein
MRFCTWAVLGVVGMTSVAHDLRAAETSQLLADCEALLTQQWDSLAKGDYDAANKTFDKVRLDGCLEQRLASQLCAIPAEQESIYDAKGDTTLVNIARNQQRLLGCEM